MNTATHFVHCMLIPLQKGYLLLPNSVIAEVMPKTGLTPEKDTAHPWLTHIEWQGNTIGVVTLEKLLDDQHTTPSSGGKFCIIKSLGTDTEFTHYAVACQGTPQLITLNESGITLAQQITGSRFIHSEIVISNTTALIPNLDQLEIALKEAL
jgi:chemosensory pili system protein ChpC